MLNKVVLAAASLLTLIQGSAMSPEKRVEEIMNTCMDALNHKTKPGPEAELFQHCSPWAKRSCCTAETAQGIGFDRKWLNFDWHHCGILSPACTQHFTKDLCFYECSPNVGPYLVSDVRKIRNQRFQNVPMCQTTCNAWWEACKFDLTCTDNWAQNFSWSTGINTCPTGSECKTFQKIFSNATSFCERIWDNSFKVVSDDNDCFRLWFSPDENPNEEVARQAARKMLGMPAGARTVFLSHQILLSTALLFFTL